MLVSKNTSRRVLQSGLLLPTETDNLNSLIPSSDPSHSAYVSSQQDRAKKGSLSLHTYVEQHPSSTALCLLPTHHVPFAKLIIIHWLINENETNHDLNHITSLCQRNILICIHHHQTKNKRMYLCHDLHNRCPWQNSLSKTTKSSLMQSRESLTS